MIKINSLKYSKQIKGLFRSIVILVIFACGPMDYNPGEYFTLFFSENAKTPAATQPYYYSPLIFNGWEFDISGSDENLNLEIKENLDAWFNYLQKKVKRETIKENLYDSKKLEVWAKNLGSTNPELAKYLVFMHETEQFKNTAIYSWEEEPEKDEGAVQEYLDKAKYNYLNTEDQFLKERYGFQYLKLAAYLENYENVLSFYEQFKKEIKTPSLISEWAHSRYAGAKMAAGDTAESIFHFAQIFANSPSRRSQAYLSGNRIHESFFQNATKLAKSEKEKANVLAYNAIQPFRDGLPAIKEIYKLDKNHDLLQLLVAREIKKNERFFFADKNSDSYHFETLFRDENYQTDKNKVLAAQKDASNYLSKLLSFTSEISNSMPENGFWQISSAYLYYLDGQTTEAKSLLEKLSDSDNAYFKKQAQFLNFEILANTEEKPDEKFLLSTLKAFRNPKDIVENNMLVKMAESLHNFYDSSPKEKKEKSWFFSCSKPKPENVSNQVKAFLALQIAAKNDTEENYFYINKHRDFYTDTCSVEFLGSLVNFLEQKNPSEMDKLLIDITKVDANYLKLAQVRGKMKLMDFEGALATLNQMDQDYLNGMVNNEYFVSYAYDLKSTNRNVELSPYDFLNGLASLKKATSSNTATASDWLEYGKAIYNLSYYGKGWLFLKRAKSSYELQYPQDNLQVDFYTTAKAKKCFENALKLSKNDELSAEICYAAALCERNQYLVKFYSNQPDDYDKLDAYLLQMVNDELPKYRTYFNKLWRDYRNTKYHKMIVKECQTYAEFVQ
jgi:hypothetical protein